MHKQDLKKRDIACFTMEAGPDTKMSTDSGGVGVLDG